MPEGNLMNDVIARYLDCWNETNPAARRKLIDEVWAADAEYIDPMAEARGRAAIDATIGAVQNQFPGLVFTLAGPVDAHHRQARFSWGLGPEGAEPLVVGFDVAVTDDRDKITTVLGFLDKVPG
jgi:SnoaL-like domain